MQNYRKDGDFGILLLRWLVILFHLQLQGKDETLTHGKDIQGDDFAASSVLLHWKC